MQSVISILALSVFLATVGPLNAANCPDRVGSTVTGLFDGGIAVTGSYAYITSFNDGAIYVYDISNPASPQEVGAESGGGNSLGVAVAGSFAIVGGNGRVTAVDISNPAIPTTSGQLILSSSLLGCDEEGLVFKLDVSGNHAFAPGECGLHILDISALPTIERLALFNTPGRAYDVDVVGTLAYVADGPGGLRIINVADPATPIEVGHIQTSGSARGVFIEGNRAYLGLDPGGLAIIDISNPSAPAMLGVFEGTCTDVAVTGRVAAGRMGESTFSRVINLIDVSNSMSPQLLGSDSFSQATNLAIQGDYLFVVGTQGLRVLDIRGCNALFIDGFESGDTLNWSYPPR
jgi:hypothetical protein